MRYKIAGIIFLLLLSCSTVKETAKETIEKPSQPDIQETMKEIIKQPVEPNIQQTPKANIKKTLKKEINTPIQKPDDRPNQD